MTERCLSFDLEWSTRDYDTGVRDGDLACLQWCELLADGTCGEPEVLPAWRGADARAREVFADALCSPSWIILGQNVAGDILKAALHWGLLSEADKAYRQGRVRCTFLAQRLIDVAWPGRMTWLAKGGKKKRSRIEVDLDALDDSEEEVRGGQEGFWKPIKYRPNRLTGREDEFTTDDDEGGRTARAGLDVLAAVHLGLDLRKLKKGEDSWRMRYGELIGTPVEDWPSEAYDYAKDDPVITAQVRAAQVRRPPPPYAGPWCDALYPSRDSVPWAPLRCERFECYAHFALEDMSRFGLCRDQPRVERMRATLQRAAQAAEGAAVKAGVVKLEVHQDMQERARRTAAGELTGSQCLADLKSAREMADRRETAALAEFIGVRPWIYFERKKATGEVLDRAISLYKAAGWREAPQTKSGNPSAEAEHLVQVVRPRADAPPEAAADLRDLTSPELLLHLQAWTDAGQEARITAAIEAANDPGLAAHLVRQKCSTFDGSFLAVLDARWRAQHPKKCHDHGAPDGPARYGFSPFKSTGRAGIRGDVRNPPKRGGVRECIVPRPGRVLVAVDYSACEMSTFADALDLLVLEGKGWSTLAQAIRAGDDCHLRLAATMRSEPYDQLYSFYKPLKKRIESGEVLRPSLLREWHDVDVDRAGAKEGNFGGMGGMGAGKFAKLQRKKGRDCTEARARLILDSLRVCWSPEMPAYFELASRATGNRGQRKSATVVHMRGGHVRGGLDYCQWCNTHFQQLAAAGAKRAAIALFRACRVDESSPLYGVADPVLFIHDEFVLEVDQDHAEAALVELGRIMEAGMAAVCRTPVRTEGKILRERWAK